MSDWLKVGIVGKAHGLRGHFFILGREGPLDLTGRKELCIADGLDDPKRVQTSLAESKMSAGKLVIACDGLNNRELIDPLRGKAIWAQRQELVVDESSEFLWSDLIGVDVVDAQGQLMGQIVEVNNYGASDVMKINNTLGKKLEIPIVETYVNMDSLGIDAKVRLIVAESVFEELWQ